MYIKLGLFINDPDAHNLFISGGKGLGKTFLLNCVLNDKKFNEQKCLYIAIMRIWFCNYYYIRCFVLILQFLLFRHHLIHQYCAEALCGLFQTTEILDILIQQGAAQELIKLSKLKKVGLHLHLQFLANPLLYQTQKYQY